MKTFSVARYGVGRTVGALVVLLVASAVAAAWLRQSTRPLPPTADALARLRAEAPPDMALIPGGNCLLGSDDPDTEDEAGPLHRVFVPSFYMDRHEVTNSEYCKFDPSHIFLPGDDDLPATNITYDQAASYARWAGKRLPTDEEWEKAARGTDGRRYPWGNRWDPHLVAPRAHRRSDPAIALRPRTLSKSKFISCNFGPPRVQRVGSVSRGVSPYGCYDMAGNAWEWVQGFYQGRSDQRILRGGAVGYGERACRTYSRGVEGSGDT